MWVFGWDVEGDAPQVTRGVLIAAPHTTNWDLPHMLAASFIFRLRISWMGKHTLFRWPFGWFMRKLGGIPIDRTSPHGVVEQVAERLRQADLLIIAVPPAGTRRKSNRWKSGFYWIAHSAGVPVICGSLDYQRRCAGLGFVFHPSGDVDADMAQVRAHYANIEGRYPALESTVRLKEELQLTADGQGQQSAQ